MSRAADVFGVNEANKAASGRTGASPGLYEHRPEIRSWHGFAEHVNTVH